MKIWMIILSVACCGAGLAAVMYTIFLIRCSHERMEQMIEAAWDGTLRETHFDEDIHSATEARLTKYLSASRERIEKAEKQQEQLSSLLSDISHQTRTPITNIRLYTQLLEEENLTEQAKELTKELNHQTEKLQGLIEALVRSSRLESGLLVMHTEKGNLSAVAEHAVAQYREKAEKKGISIVLKLSPTQVILDEKWTEEAICNLVDNAIKYTPQGGCLTLESKNYDFFGAISVKDNGLGIAEEEQTKIFERFYRTQDAWKQEGVGIGLYLTRQIASGQSGYVKVKSEKGKGSTFSLYLPKNQI